MSTRSWLSYCELFRALVSVFVFFSSTVLEQTMMLGAAMNVPSAVAMISMSFPDRQERSRAYAVYGAFGAIGNCLGSIIGGVISSQTSWRWGKLFRNCIHLETSLNSVIVFYVIAMLVIPFALVSWFILPTHTNHIAEERKNLDWPGVFSLTIGLVLFVFAVSQASAIGMCLFPECYPFCQVSTFRLEVPWCSRTSGSFYCDVWCISFNRAYCEGCSSSFSNVDEQKLYAFVLLRLEYILVGVCI